MANLGSTPSLLLGFAVGGAASAAFDPALEIAKQQAWADAANRIVDAGTLARLVAEGGVDLGSAQPYAHRNGYNNNQLDALIYLAQTVPGGAEALHLWRLGEISDADFTHTLVKGGLDQRYVQPILNSKLKEQLGLGDIAYAVVRGILPAPAYVPVPPPATGDNVPRYPQVQADPEALAARIGYDAQALEILVGRSGLSMAPVMAAQAHFRGIIGPNDYLMAIAEGDLRTEWAQPVLDASRQILTADQYMELALRGWTTLADAKANAAKHGMDDANAQLLYELRRRPLSVPTITKALARGGTFDTANAPLDDPYAASVHEANLGPEWYSLAEAMKYTYPSAFVLRQLLKDGAVSETEASDIFKYEGYPPALADKIAAAYAPTGGATADPHLTKAANSLYTTTHKSYVAREIDDATATAALEAAGVPGGSVPAVLELWQAERDLIRKQLTPAQVAKAIKTGAINPATGVAWTMQDGLTALLARGYDQADATTLLEESA